MKTSTHSVRLIASSLFAAVTVVATLAASGGSAFAAKPKPTPRPTIAPTPFVYPTPAPTAVPPVSPSVPVPSAIQVISNFPDAVQIRVSPGTQLSDAELLSGPTSAAGPVIVLVADNGLVSFSRLVENSDYVFRYRNKISPDGSINFIVSPWVQFSFHTPTGDSLRPSIPQNLRVIDRTATTVTVRWDAVPTAARYDFSLNGGASSQTGICGGAYCTPPDPLTATFARPAPGTSVLFSITATRATAICGPYCFPDTRFDTSLPATLVVTN